MVSIFLVSIFTSYLIELRLSGCELVIELLQVLLKLLCAALVISLVRRRLLLELVTLQLSAPRWLRCS